MQVGKPHKIESGPPPKSNSKIKISKSVQLLHYLKCPFSTKIMSHEKKYENVTQIHEKNRQQTLLKDAQIILDVKMYQILRTKENYLEKIKE